MKKLLLLSSLVLVLSSFIHKKYNWVAIGDSITYLNDHLDETGNRVNRGYLSRVCDKMKNIHYINQGHNGWTSGDIADKIDKLGIPEADVYSIFLGTNDWWQGRILGTMNDYKSNTGNATVFGSFRIIINKLHNLNSNAKIIVITPMQRTDFVYINDPNNNAYGSYQSKNCQMLEQFAEAIKEIANYEKIEFIDIYHTKSLSIENLVKFKRLKNPETGEYKNYPFPDYIKIPYEPVKDEYPYPKDAINMSYDGLHPSDAGNAVIAELLIDILKKYYN